MAIDAAELAGKLSLDDREFQDGLRRAEGALGRLGGAAQSFGVVAAAAAAAGFAAITAGAVASVQAAGDFEAGMLRFGSVAGSSIEAAGLSLDDFKAKALELGSTTQFSAAEAQAAMTELARGGVPVADVLNGATAAALDLAAAGEVNLGAAADIVARQLGVWADQGVAAADVSNLIAQAANASTVGVQDLALGLAQVGGSARVAGASFDETVQTLALIAPGFQSASDAGTSLKTFFAALPGTTGPAIAQMKALGLYTDEAGSRFFDAQGNFIGMEAAAQLLQDATKDLSEEQKLLAFNAIFGSDAIRSAAAIAEAGGAGFRQMGADMSAAGTAAEQATARNQGFNFALESLKGTIETLQIVIGTALLPPLTSLVQSFTDGLGVVLTFAQGITSSADPVRALGDALLSLLPATGESTAALGGLGAMWATLQEAVARIAAAYQATVDAIFSQVASFIEAHGDEIGAFLGETWTTIVDIVTTATALMSGIIQGVLALIVGFTREHGAAIQQVLSNAWTIISNVIRAALALIQGVLRAALAVFRGDWQGAWQAIQQMSVSVTLALGNIIRAGLDSIAAYFGTSLDGIKRTWESNWNNLVSIARTLADRAMSAIRDAFGRAGDIGRAMVDGIRGGITGAAEGLARSAAETARRALNAAREALGIRSPSKVFAEEVGKPMVEGIRVGIEANTAPLLASLRDLSTLTLAPLVQPSGESFVPRPAYAAASGGPSIAYGDISVTIGAGNGVTPAQVRQIVLDVTTEQARKASTMRKLGTR